MLETLVTVGLWSLALNAGAEVSQATSTVPAHEAGPSADATGAKLWPLPNRVHPLAHANVASTPQAFAAAVAPLEPAERLKAIHDWVTLVLHYASSSANGPQSAAEALAKHAANCEGYAQLFAQVARLAGFEAEVVQGLLKVPRGAPQAHAWNVVRLGPRSPWQLVDVTLDDPNLRGDGLPDATYRTDYLFIPPALAALDHWPFLEVWQLGAPRPSRAAFAAAHLTTTASLARSAITLVTSPEHADGGVALTFENPASKFLLLAADGVACGAPQTGRRVTLKCDSQPHQRLELLVHDESTGLFLTAFEFSD